MVYYYKGNQKKCTCEIVKKRSDVFFPFEPLVIVIHSTSPDIVEHWSYFSGILFTILWNHGWGCLFLFNATISLYLYKKGALFCFKTLRDWVDYVGKRKKMVPALPPISVCIACLESIGAINIPRVNKRFIIIIRIIKVIIITITKLSNPIGYQLPWFQP